jgi:hypothetical protein
MRHIERADSQFRPKSFTLLPLEVWNVLRGHAFACAFAVRATQKLRAEGGYLCPLLGSRFSLQGDSRMRRVIRLLFVLAIPVLTFGQNPPASDPQALSYAAQSIASLTGGNSISDVTLTGNVTWNGSGSDTGTATLLALGTGESNTNLSLTSGTRSEIRDAQTGIPLGKWINPDTTSGYFASQNCWTDAVWFFPALGSLAAGPNVVLSYIGQEIRNGGTVQHIQSYVYDPNWPSGVTPSDQQLSTLDFYLDANTLLPVALTFNAHPDNNANTNLLIEVDFSNYQNVSGPMVPMHIQKYTQGNLLLDLTLSGAAFNSGLPLSDFIIN